MTIRIFPSQFPGEAVETHEFSGLIGDWFKQKGLEFESKPNQPVTLTVDGKPVPSSEWASFSVDEDDEVEIRIIPHGWGVLLYAAVAALTIAAVVMARKPTTMASQARSIQGRNLDSASADANRAMLGQVVPELAGRFRRFPDYLNQPRRYFASDREQILEFMVCIGPGRYQIKPEEVKIGDTPFTAIGDDTIFTFYEPGADLSANPAHVNWYNVSEVGGTSSGTAGLELSSAFVEDVTPIAGTYGFEGNEITFSPDQGNFPEGWGTGTIFTVRFARSFVITRAGVAPDQYNVFTGNFSNIMPLANGQQIIVGSTTYVVGNVSVNTEGVGSIRLFNVSDGTPVNTFTPATSSLTIYKSNRTYYVTAKYQNLVIVQARDGGTPVTWPGWGAINAINPVWSVVDATIFGEWSNWFRACPNSEKTNTFEVDFFFPQGLGRVNDGGVLRDYAVSVEVEYRDVSGGISGNTFFFIYTRRTADQIGFTERFTIPMMLPEVRVRRRGATNPDGAIRNTMQWYGLRTILSGVSSYPDWTTMAVRLRTGGKLAAQSENKINVIATRILPTLENGEWTEPKPTRDISAFAKYIASTIQYGDENIDMDELERLHEVWKSRNETADHIFDQTTVKNAFNVIFGAGMSELTISDGQIKPVRDDVRTQKEFAYSPQNMTEPLRRVFRTPKHDDPDGVQVEYINEETWTKETIDCLLPGDLGLNKRRIKVDGVTNETRAWRIGMRERREIKYRVWNYEFSTELDGLNSQYLSFDSLFDDIPGYGQSSIMQSITPYEGAALIESGEPLQWVEGADHVVAYRRPDGTIAGPFAAEPGDDDYTLVARITESWPVITLNQEPPHMFFGTTERWTFPVLITEINPRGMDSVSLSAVNYDARVYADDNNEPE